MAVMHYVSENGLTCSTAKDNKTTDIQQVTCKKCIKRIRNENNKPVHFEWDGFVVCKSKKSIDQLKTTSDKQQVTCKKCIKRINEITYGATSTKDKKYGFCLKLKSGTLMSLGYDDTDLISMINLTDKGGHTTTSMKMKNVRGIIPDKEQKFFQKYFENKKQQLQRRPTIREVLEDFE